MSGRLRIFISVEEVLSSGNLAGFTRRLYALDKLVTLAHNLAIAGGLSRAFYDGASELRYWQTGTHSDEHGFKRALAMSAAERRARVEPGGAG